MIRPARQSSGEHPENGPGATGDSSAPATLRFPPRERPTTIRRPQRETPFDLEDEAARDQRGEDERAAGRQRAEREREAKEREESIRQARAALAGQSAPPELAAVVWDAHEAIAAARDGVDGERPEYVPIARESRGFAASLPIERVPASVYVAPYNLPERSPNPKQRPLDLLRRTLLSVAAIGFAVVAFGLIAGTGVPAMPFGPAAAPLNPLGPAALFWPVLAIATVALAAHMWWPDQLSARRQRALGVPALIAVLGAAAWCVGAGQNLPWVALSGAVVLFGSSWEGIRRLNLLTARTRRERWLTDWPVEAMLGWGAFAVAWSLSSLSAATGRIVAPASLWASLLLLACMVPVCIVGMSERGRLVPALAFGFGAVWLMAARLMGGWNDPIIMVVAGLGGIVALLTALARRQEIGHNERVALLGLPTR